MTTRRSKGDGSLFKRKDGYWIGRVELPSVDGRRRFKTVSSRDRNITIQRLKKLRADVDAGRIAVTANTTVERWLNRWLEDIHGPELRPGTKDDYARTIRLHIVPYIGHRRLSQLTPEHVRQMHKQIESSRTAQLAHIILQRALKDAVREGMLSRNVAEVVHKPRHTVKQREPLTADQAKQLLRSAIGHGDPMATRWAAALLLGARKGELLGLQWSRVDLDNGVVDLAWQLQELKQEHGCGEPARLQNGQVEAGLQRPELPPAHAVGGLLYPCGKQRPGYCPQARWNLPRGFEHLILHRSLALTRPKTQAGTRIVPIPAPLWAMFEQMRLEAKFSSIDNNPHDLVWHHTDGRPIGPRRDHTNWTAALKLAGLPYAPPHAARHTTATLLMQAGVDEQTRMQILGHVSVTATRGYAHIDQTVTRQAMTALNQLLGD